MQNDKNFRPDRIGAYFHIEWLPLALVTVSGLIYNIGLLATPWFEGRLAQCLTDILDGSATAAAMAILVLTYVLVTLVVQAARFIKRFYVRRFANNINRRMKGILYANLVRQSRAALEKEGAGELMTKAISDVDDCVEGMRKFTTEIFDTGVALVGYIVMLLVYDWRLALLSLLFTPVSYICAAWMKKPVQREGAACKKAAGALSTATLDRAQNAATYRIYGCETAREARYEDVLTTYEKTAVRSSVWQSALPPLYLAVSEAGVLFILWFGAKNVPHQTADAPAGPPAGRDPAAKPETLTVNKLGFAYRGGAPVLQDITFTAQPGRIFGITGAVACGKSTLGKAFLCELPYTGSIQYGGREMAGMTDAERCGVVGYLGHDPELLSDSIRNNILLGRDDDAWKYLRAVCLEDEVKAMPNGLDTRVGDGGVRLSGGQQQRLALARTLAHPRPLLVLDDPFSALDRKTEEQVFANLRKMTAGSTVLLISHRLYLFPQMDGVLWIQDGKAVCAAHEELMAQNPQYAALVNAQEGGEQDEPEK